jgi:hypothetical protein
MWHKCPRGPISLHGIGEHGRLGGELSGDGNRAYPNIK